MSKLDKKCFILTCPKCKSTESTCAEESGHPCKSSWSRPEFSEFKIQFVSSLRKEPEIATAICKKCGAKATIESHYCPPAIAEFCLKRDNSGDFIQAKFEMSVCGFCQGD